MAGYTLSAQMIGADKMREIFAKAGDVVAREFGVALKRSAILIEQKAKEGAPRNYGNLAGSITSTEPIVSGTNVTAKVGTNIKYAPYMEYGTAPHFPPMAALKEWARRKLGDEKLAFLVARSIARKGTKAREYFKKAREEGVTPHEQNIKAALDRIMSFLSS